METHTRDPWRPFQQVSTGSAARTSHTSGRRRRKGCHRWTHRPGRRCRRRRAERAGRRCCWSHHSRMGRCTSEMVCRQCRTRLRARRVRRVARTSRRCNREHAARRNPMAPRRTIRPRAAPAGKCLPKRKTTRRHSGARSNRTPHWLAVAAAFDTSWCHPRHKRALARTHRVRRHMARPHPEGRRSCHRGHRRSGTHRCRTARSSDMDRRRPRYLPRARNQKMRRSRHPHSSRARGSRRKPVRPPAQCRARRRQHNLGPRSADRSRHLRSLAAGELERIQPSARKSWTRKRRMARRSETWVPQQHPLRRRC